MKPFLLYIALLIPIVAKAQEAWAVYEPFGDTIGVYSISLYNANTAWFAACRTDGHDVAMVARTIDGGATFNTSTLPLQGAPYTACITSTDESTAYVIALQNWGNAITLKTFDGGQTWQEANTPWDPVVSWPDYIHAFSPAKVCQIGDPRNGEFEVYNTANGGIAWTLVDPANIPDPLPGEFGFNNGGSAVGNHIWFVTNRGRVYHSANSGYNWDVVQTPLAEAGALAYSDENNGIVTYWGNQAGSDQLYRTTNGGAAWEAITLPISETYHFYGIPAYLKGTSIMVAGIFTEPQFFGKNQTWISKDRGDTWIQISDGESIGWPAFNSATHGWAGEWGPINPTDHTTRVYKYIGSPLVGLLSPNTLDAKVRISPNPATEFVQIEVHSTEPSSFWCMLHDAQGRLLRKTDIKQTADFSQKVDLQNLSAGTYTITVTSEKGSMSTLVIKE